MTELWVRNDSVCRQARCSIHLVLVPSMFRHHYRVDGAGDAHSSNRADLLTLLRDARRIIIQLVVIVQHINRYPVSTSSSEASNAETIVMAEIMQFFMNLPIDYQLHPPDTPPIVSSDELASAHNGVGDGNLDQD